MTAGGESAAVAAGLTWEELADEVLFVPAGMTSTSMRFSAYEAAENRAEQHVRTDGRWEAAFDRMPDAQAPAGGVSSNVIDLAQWLRLQLAGSALDGEQVIDENALDLTHTTKILKSPPLPTIADSPRSYGLGIVVLTNGEPIGVPEAITDAYFDQLQTGSWPDDIFAIWTERFSGLYGEPEEFDDPGADRVPALDDDAYTGTYTNDYVGDIEVIVTDGALAVVVGPAEGTFVLTHIAANTFTYVQDPELPEFLSAAIFEIGPDGVATTLAMSGFDAEGMGTLERV